MYGQEYSKARSPFYCSSGYGPALKYNSPGAGFNSEEAVNIIIWKVLFASL